MINGLAERIKTLRIKNNYTQKELADLLDISPSIVSGYETGERTPSVEVLLKIAGLFRCSSDYLLGLRNDNPNLLDLTGLSDKEKQSLILLVESLKK